MTFKFLLLVLGSAPPHTPQTVKLLDHVLSHVTVYVLLEVSAIQRQTEMHLLRTRVTGHCNAINEAHLPIKVDLEVLQSHHMFQSISSLISCSGVTRRCYAENAVRWLGLSIL